MTKPGPPGCEALTGDVDQDFQGEGGVAISGIANSVTLAPGSRPELLLSSASSGTHIHMEPKGK